MRRFTLTSLWFISLILWLSLWSPQTQGQTSPPKWDKEYVGTTLGGILENPYSQMLSQCTNGLYKKIVFVKRETDKTGQEYSALPRVLQERLGDHLKEQVWHQNTYSLARIFAYAYDSQDIVRSYSRLSSTYLLFDRDLTADPGSMLPEGVAGLIYTHNCSGVISAALKFSGGYTLPIATIKGALDAEYSNKEKSVLSFVTGAFTSPFADLISNSNSKRPAYERLAAYLTLWRWYENDNIDKSKSYWIIRDFNGAALFQGFEQSRNIDGNVSLQGNLGLPFVSADNRNTAAVVQGLNIRINGYDTFAFLNGAQPEVGMDPLPNPSKIKTVVGSFSTTLDRNYRDVLEEQVTVSHIQRSPGVPKDLCSESFWNKTISNDLLIERVVTNQQDICEFTVSYSPPISVFRSKDDLALNYTFKSNTLINGMALELPAETVHYHRSVSPEFSSVQYSQGFTARDIGEGNRELSWSVKINVNDSAGVVDWKQLLLAPTMQISCEGSTALNTNSPVITVFDTAFPKTKTVQLAVTYAVNTNEYDLSRTRQCHLNGTMRFGRNNAAGGPATIDRALPDLPIIFPQKATPAPSPSPTPIAQPGSSPSPSPTPKPSPDLIEEKSHSGLASGAAIAPITLLISVLYFLRT